jgi:hypothetical protein
MEPQFLRSASALPAGHALRKPIDGSGRSLLIASGLRREIKELWSAAKPFRVNVHAEKNVADA